MEMGPEAPLRNCLPTSRTALTSTVFSAQDSAGSQIVTRRDSVGRLRTVNRVRSWNKLRKSTPKDNLQANPESRRA